MVLARSCQLVRQFSDINVLLTAKGDLSASSCMQRHRHHTSHYHTLGARWPSCVRPTEATKPPPPPTQGPASPWCFNFEYQDSRLNTSWLLVSEHLHHCTTANPTPPHRTPTHHYPILFHKSTKHWKEDVNSLPGSLVFSPKFKMQLPYWQGGLGKYLLIQA